MKTTIIFLGLAVLSFTNGKAANELNEQDLVQQDLATVSVETAQSQSQLVLVNKEASKITLVNTIDEAVIYVPNVLSTSTNTNSLRQVIAEDKLITDCQEEVLEPLSLEVSLEDKIFESNQIIESNLDNEVYPLDFEKINRSLKNNKPYNNNMAVIMDLKL